MRRVYVFVGLLVTLASFTLTGCAGTETSRSTGTYIDDKTISTKVKTQLAGDSLTQALQVEVETYDGVVQLSGFVDSQEHKDRAEEIAKGVTNVKKVENNLIVK